MSSRAGSEDAAKLTPLTTAKSPNLDPGRPRQLHKRPFKLRFGKQHDLGRSAMSSMRPTEIPPVLSSKFYSREYQDFKMEKRSTIGEAENRIDSIYSRGPRRTFTCPLLESHTYGWHHDIKLTDRQYDRRFNFGIQNSPMVKYRLLVLASEAATNAPKTVQIKPKN